MGPTGNENFDITNNKELGRTLSEDNHGHENARNKLEDAPQNSVIKNLKSDILNGFPHRQNAEGGFKVFINRQLLVIINVSYHIF